MRAAPKVVSFAQVCAVGRATPVPFVEPSPQHVGLIMFTSGSTGKPKGVMLKHSSIVAAVAGLEDYFCAQVSNASTYKVDMLLLLLLFLSLSPSLACTPAHSQHTPCRSRAGLRVKPAAVASGLYLRRVPVPVSALCPPG